MDTLYTTEDLPTDEDLTRIRRLILSCDTEINRVMHLYNKRPSVDPIAQKLFEDLLRVRSRKRSWERILFACECAKE